MLTDRCDTETSTGFSYAHVTGRFDAYLRGVSDRRNGYITCYTEHLTTEYAAIQDKNERILTHTHPMHQL